MSVPPENLVELVTERFRLRPLRVEDFDWWLELWMRPSHCQYIMAGSMTKEQIREGMMRGVNAFKKRPCGTWLILEGDTRIGYIGIKFWEDIKPDGREVELLYGVCQEHQGRGVAKECAMVVSEYALVTLAVARLTAAVEVAHVASTKVALSVGMQAVSDCCYYEPNEDDVYYAVTLDQFNAFRNRSTGQCMHAPREERSDGLRRAP